jgi:hypothetical protein
MGDEKVTTEKIISRFRNVAWKEAREGSMWKDP